MEAQEASVVRGHRKGFHRLVSGGQGGAHVSSVAVGWSFGFVILTDGQVVPLWHASAFWCKPRVFPSVHHISKISTSWSHVLALDRNTGVVYSFGWNSYGQCGHGSRDSIQPSLRPISTLQTTRVCDIAAGERHSLAISEEGQVWGWGSNQYGQLGLLEDLPALSGREQIELELEREQQRRKSSPNSVGAAEEELAESAHGFVHVFPKQLILPPDMRAVQVSCGWSHSMLIDAKGRLFSFGWGMYGQLGQGDFCNEHYPVQIRFSDLDNESTEDSEAEDFVVTEQSEDESLLEPSVLECSCGVWHSAAILKDGSLWTWGYNSFGQVDFTFFFRYPIVCFFLSGCYKLGTGDTQGSCKPSRVTIRHQETLKVGAIRCGHRHTMAQSDNGDVYCWGWNKYGQCGIEARLTTESPPEDSIVTQPQKVWDSVPLGAIAAGVWASFAW
ncbi:Ultraviolet-B receptor uvr8 [Balamuthia mandrillaris]